MFYNGIHPADKVVIRPKPQLKDFHNPSDEMKKYEYLWIIIRLEPGLLFGVSEKPWQRFRR
jgi:hypothetical protein